MTKYSRHPVFIFLHGDVSPRSHPQKQMLNISFPRPISRSRLDEIAKHNSNVKGREEVSWLEPETCSDAEIFRRLRGNHKGVGGGGGQSSDLVVKQRCK